MSPNIGHIQVASMTAACQGREQGVYLRVLKNTLARRAVLKLRLPVWLTRWSARWFTVFLLTRLLQPRCCSISRRLMTRSSSKGFLRWQGSGCCRRRPAGIDPDREELLSKLAYVYAGPGCRYGACFRRSGREKQAEAA